MEIETIFIAGQVAWELFLVTTLSVLLALAYQAAAKQWKKINKSS
jgi:hypothetical protein